MLFNSFSFLLFLVFVVAMHSLPLPWKVRKFNLLAASYLFYASWSPSFTLLLVFATMINWVSAGLMDRWSRHERWRRVALWCAIVLNIGLLCAFKYGNDFIGIWNWAATRLHAADARLQVSILLPLGLSFFTLQSLSYTIDVYRRTISSTRSLLDFALFVAFFPVLLAGPLLRASDFLPQCAVPRRATADNIGYGATLITLGVFLKALADAFLAPVVLQVYAPKLQPSTLSAWVGTMAFAGQDYCDLRWLCLLCRRNRCVLRIHAARQFSRPIRIGGISRPMATLAHHARRLDAGLRFFVARRGV